jgi:small subunit ribosomal protein S1
MRAAIRLFPEGAMMSDTDKPTEPTTPPAKPPREKPPQPSAGRVPSLQHEQSYGFGKRIDAFDEDMERQLQEAMSGMSDKDLYGEPDPRRRGQAAPDAGPKKGKVLRIHGQDVFIDLPGGRTQGVLPLMQFSEGPPALGTEIEVTIEGFDHENGVLILSRKGAAVEADWSSVAVGMTVEARVTAVNKGGLSVDVNGIRGFMPISQIDLYRVENAEQFVNQRLLCLVTEVDAVERNFVVSRRALLEKQREETRDKLWNELAEGQMRQGVVRSVRDFGAFVDLGGVDGLLHVSEMSWQRVQDPATIVQPGQTVKVVVLKIDRERRKVGLGLKQLTASPWDNITEKYHTGDVVAGKVSRLMDFGAFVELEPAIEGLIHISELATQRVFRVGDIVKAGQEVQVKVLSVDPAQRRISLSLKAAQAKVPEPEPEEEAEAEPPTPVKPPRPRTTPLRGGTGSNTGQLFSLPKPPSKDKG